MALRPFFAFLVALPSSSPDSFFWRFFVFFFANACFSTSSCQAPNLAFNFRLTLAAPSSENSPLSSSHRSSYTASTKGSLSKSSSASSSAHAKAWSYNASSLWTSSELISSVPQKCLAMACNLMSRSLSAGTAGSKARHLQIAVKSSSDKSCSGWRRVCLIKVRGSPSCCMTMPRPGKRTAWKGTISQSNGSVTKMNSYRLVA